MRGVSRICDNGIIISYMSLKTVIGIIVLLLLIWGLFHLLGGLGDKSDSSSSYLQESVRTIDKVGKMKEERNAVIKKQEDTLMDNGE